MPKIYIFEKVDHEINRSFFGSINNKKITIGERKKNIDLMCIWGKNDRNYYTHFLKSKFLVSGSIRNNLYEKQKFKSNRR